MIAASACQQVTGRRTFIGQRARRDARTMVYESSASIAA